MEEGKAADACSYMAASAMMSHKQFIQPPGIRSEASLKLTVLRLLHTVVAVVQKAPICCSPGLAAS